MLDFAVFTQIAFVNAGFDPDGDRRSMEYHQKVESYPDMEELEERLGQLGLCLNKEVSPAD